MEKKSLDNITYDFMIDCKERVEIVIQLLNNIGEMRVNPSSDVLLAEICSEQLDKVLAGLKEFIPDDFDDE